VIGWYCAPNSSQNIFPAGSLILLGVNIATNLKSGGDTLILWPVCLVNVMKLFVMPVTQYMFVSALGKLRL
jgi:hypothetical protein